MGRVQSEKARGTGGLAHPQGGHQALAVRASHDTVQEGANDAH